MLLDERPTILTEELIGCVVHTFYDRVRQDPMLGPIFEARLSGRWNVHLDNMVAFWSTVAMRSGRYTGKPHAAHQGLSLEHTHFLRWLQLATMHGPMMEGMRHPDPDVAFMLGMIPHHQGAIDMARVQLQFGADAETRSFAEHLIAEQEAEIRQMEDWLVRRGIRHARFESQREPD